MTQTPSRTDLTPSGSTTAGRRFAAGAAWMLAAQVVHLLTHAGYAVITARMLSPAAFGAFAGMIAATLFVLLFANGGLGPAAMRTLALDEHERGALHTVAWALGLLGLLGTLAIAEPWSRLWGAAEVTDLVLWSAPFVALTPVAGLANALARRDGAFRQTAIASSLASVAGVIIGAAAVYLTRRPEALVVSPTVTVLVTLVALQWVTRALPRLRLPDRTTLRHLSFTGRVTVNAIIVYVTHTLPRILVANLFGGGVMGYWNRAESVTVGPLTAVDQALRQTTYPELRHLRGEPTSATRAKATDLLILLAWGTMVPGLAVTAAVPFALPWLLGEQWTAAVPFAVALAVVATLSPVKTQLGSMFEVLGQFKILYVSQAVELAVSLGIGLAGLAVGRPALFAWGIGAGMLVRMVICCTVFAQQRRFALPRLVAGIASAVAAGAALGTLVVAFGLAASHDQRVPLLAAFLGIVVALAALVWRHRRRIPVLALAHRYGLVRAS